MIFWEYVYTAYNYDQPSTHVVLNSGSAEEQLVVLWLQPCSTHEVKLQYILLEET